VGSSARRPVLAGVAAAVALACAAASPAGTEQRLARASFTFGVGGGNIVPFTATISRRGEVRFAQGDRRSKRAPLSIAAVNRLVALAKAERFDALPASITCAGVLPDVGTEFITVRTATRSKTVRERGGCNRRFEKLYARLNAAIAQR
jgi:hypothetical protein